MRNYKLSPDCYYIILRSISLLVIVRQGSIVGGDANWGNTTKNVAQETGYTLYSEAATAAAATDCC